METYPVIKIRKGKVMKNNKIIKKRDAIDFIEELGKKNGIVYAIDLDGYKKNSANLKIYKEIGKYLWIDAFPRYVDDVMDIIITGVKRITLRDMPERELKEIKEMAEKEIFVSGKNAYEAANRAIKYNFNGVVLYEEQEIKKDIQTWKIYMNEGIIRRIK